MGDAKGVTVATLYLGGKVITRHNLTMGGRTVQPIVILGVEFLSWHAEMRIIYYLMRNAYYRHLLEKNGFMEMMVIRYTNSGFLGATSKPCEKCQKVFSLFKKRYFNDSFVLRIRYHEAGKLRLMEF